MKKRVCAALAAMALTAFTFAARSEEGTETQKKETLSANYGTGDDRVVLIYGPINNDTAKTVIGRLRYLSTKSDAPIEMHINSGGGEVNAGMAIYDYMQSIPNPIKTVCMGNAQSMGAFLLAAGSPGMRESYGHCEIMLHQPSWGKSGRITEIGTVALQGQFSKQTMESLMAAHSGLSAADYAEMTREDLYITPQQARDLGFIDRVIATAKHPRAVRKPTLPADFCAVPGRESWSMCRDPHTPRLTAGG